MYNEIDSYSGREFFQSKDPLSIGVRERKSKNEYELRVSYGNFDKDDHKTLNGIDIFLREFFDENPNAIVKFDNNYIDGNFFIGDFLVAIVINSYINTLSTTILEFIRPCG